VEIVGTCSPDKTLPQVLEHKPEIALLDVPTEIGLPLVIQLRTADSDLKSVAIGVLEGDDDVVAWAEVGVAGYAPADQSLEELIDVIACVARGQTSCSPRVASALLRRVQSVAPPSGAALLATLTERESEIAALLAQGLSNKEIAVCLSIALPTVKSHVHSILSKFNARRRGEAVARMRSNGVSRGADDHAERHRSVPIA
jgi:DNA-binding NarL/FixJ family response regulator